EDPNLEDDHMRVILGDGFDPSAVDLGSFTPDTPPDAGLSTASQTPDTTTPIPDAGPPIDGGGVPCVN
ncbi:MAG TPA: LytR family transcriptional regulator, partial [Mycobacterium sp.]|nr:LytR family transcriptional regulator [Mycobacterium sp.]